MKKYKEDDTLIDYKSQNIFLNLSENIMIEYLQGDYVRVYEFGDYSTPTTKIAKKVIGIKSDVIMINNKTHTIPKPLFWFKHKKLKTA